MGEHSVDWQAFQRLDNALVVDFLTSAASALNEKGITSHKDTDNLRLVLSGIHSAPESRERSLLIELDKQHAEFLGLMTARFGTANLCLNLLRHTLRGNLVETRRTIAEFGQALVKKAELLFNRAFYVFQSGRCQRQTLFSTVIVDFSESLAQSVQLLDQVLEALSLMNPSDMAPADPTDQEVDLAIAKALGFKGLVAHTLPSHSETELKRKIAQALTLVADAASEISEQLTANTGAEAAYDVVAACEWLKAECQRLSFLELPQSESVMVWEVRRRNLSSCLQGINESLKLVASASLASLAQDQTQTQTRYPEAVKRRISFDMIAAGATPAKAAEATESLFEYLKKNQVTPSQMIPGELGRIHPSLLPRSLEVLVALAQGTGLAPHATGEKTRTMARVKKLAAVFVATTTLMGCGLKTKPKSDILELRPDIPFRVDSPSPEKETNGVVGGAGSHVSAKKP